MMENIWGQKLRDAILSNSAVRDGLTDEEAQPLIDWGLGLADIIGKKMASLPDPEAAYETYLAALPKLMTRINWLTTFSQKKGAEWTKKTIAQVQELSQTLFEEQAPPLDAENMLRYLILGAEEIDRKSRVMLLIQKLTPENKDKEGIL
ncbi:MAG: hypothetical protein K8I82_31960 [Anaerolineae bacterium]|nr:hypothetical protein [Anaerolineae bacterium]